LTRTILFFLSLLLPFSADALELKFLAEQTLSSSLKFKKTKVGGLSGLYYEASTGALYAISDDRGMVNEPRIYEMKLDLSDHGITVKPEKVISLSANETAFAHKSSKSKSSIFSKVLDLEGISLTPWGDFLLVNEGDANKRPRVSPQVLDVKKDGTIFRSFDVPADFLPEPSGRQTKGAQNNMAFEGLAASLDGKHWVVATEAPLVQDGGKGISGVRFLVYEMSEAWMIKPVQQWLYPLDNQGSEKKSLMDFQRGISEVHFLDEKRLLVMERAVVVNSGGIQFEVNIYEVDLGDLLTKKKTTSEGLDSEPLEKLSKKLVLSLSSLEKKLGHIENFEGMTLGPPLSDGRKTLILVSDNNFMRNLRTQFLLFEVKESGHEQVNQTNSLETAHGR